MTGLVLDGHPIPDSGDVAGDDRDLFEVEGVVAGIVADADVGLVAVDGEHLAALVEAAGASLEGVGGGELAEEVGAKGQACFVTHGD